MDKEKKIIESWTANATNWIDILDNNGIESRKLITNKAIVDAVCKSKPASVLDVGCGEGWLSGKLADNEIEVTGIDVIPELIYKAKQKVKGNFLVASYEEIAEGKIVFPGLFNIVVINFALIAKESTESLLAAIPRYLSPGGKLIIQTLHPYSRKSIDDYTTGWKDGSWDGLGNQFTLPYEWYFRTMEDWIELLGKSGFSKLKITDVLHPVSEKQLSVIFECELK